MQFTRLSLTGFKSFVDRTELAIEPGMTGIVGPNGCGKSNLVEALRWVMGENSARRMRGGEMDDVIFGGTSTRPARNLAEVSLLVDNEGQDIPLPFAAGPDLEIMRRIERGEGSDFRINGYFGYRAVTRIALVQGPPPLPEHTAPPPPRPLLPAERQALDRRLDGISDPALRMALERLGSAIIGRR